MLAGFQLVEMSMSQPHDRLQTGVIVTGTGPTRSFVTKRSGCGLPPSVRLHVRIHRH